MKKEKFDFRVVSEKIREDLKKEFQIRNLRDAQRFVKEFDRRLSNACSCHKNYLPQNPKTLKQPIHVIYHGLQTLGWRHPKYDITGVIKASNISGYVFEGRNSNGVFIRRSIPLHVLRNVRIFEFLEEAQTKNEK